MRLTGALSNGQVASTLVSVAGKKRELELAGAGASPTCAPSLLRLPQGAIQAAIVAELRASAETLKPKEIHNRIQRQLGRSISYDTVASFLSVTCRAQKPTVVRVSPGRYRLTR